jgi:hypothetical protein
MRGTIALSQINRYDCLLMDPIMVCVVVIAFLAFLGSVMNGSKSHGPGAAVGTVETHTYEKHSLGEYYRSSSVETMDKHIEKMVAGGWDPLTSSSNTIASYALAKGLAGGALLGPLGLLAGKGGKKESTITITFIKKR